MTILDNTDYINLLEKIKNDVKNSRIRAHLSVNKEMIMLYWRIGKEILSRQEKNGWGSKVIERLSMDLKSTFPGIKGLSARNIKYMRKFNMNFPEYEFVKQLVAQIPWGHITHILDRVQAEDDRKWYIQKTIENGWSRNVLLMNINAKSHLHLGKAQNNFSANLPKATSDLAIALVKSEYEETCTPPSS